MEFELLQPEPRSAEAPPQDLTVELMVACLLGLCTIALLLSTRRKAAVEDTYDLPELSLPLPAIDPQPKHRRSCSLTHSLPSPSDGWEEDSVVEVLRQVFTVDEMGGVCAAVDKFKNIHKDERRGAVLRGGWGDAQRLLDSEHKHQKVYLQQVSNGDSCKIVRGYSVVSRELQRCSGVGWSQCYGKC